MNKIVQNSRREFKFKFDELDQEERIKADELKKSEKMVVVSGVANNLRVGMLTVIFYFTVCLI